jgi:tetratricopeptide (TPR) repeat protein
LSLPAGTKQTSFQVAAIAVFLAACIAYATALTGTFVYDDLHSVADNQSVRSLANLGRFFVDPTMFSAAGNVMYRPVLLCSFAFDYALGDGSPLMFKLTNLLLHGAVAVLLLSWLRALNADLRAAALTAALFAVHPLASEAVNMVSARSELLCILGIVLALRSQVGMRTGVRNWAALVCVGAVLACGSKETGALLPVLMLCQEGFLGNHGPRVAMRGVVTRLLPACLIVVAYLATRRLLLGQATADLLGRSGNDPMYGSSRDLLTQICTMSAALPKVLLQAIWPSGLSLDPSLVYYRTLWSVPVVAGAIGMLSLTVVGLRAPRRYPLLALGTIFTWMTALPWVVIPLNLPLSEHRYYGPLIGLALLITPRIDWLLRCLPTRAHWLPAMPLIVFALIAATRSLDYRDECTLWQGVLAQNPNSFRANWGCGAALLLRGEYASAEPLLARSVALYPAFRTARRSWIECMLILPMDQGWPFRALIAAEELARQKNDDPYYRILHANAALLVGIASDDRTQIETAERLALSCLLIAPPKALVYRLAASCRQRLHDLPGALAHLDTALARGLDFTALRVERSDLLRLLGREVEADSELRAMFKKAPMDGSVRAAMARRYASPPR